MVTLPANSLGLAWRPSRESVSFHRITTRAGGSIEIRIPAFTEKCRKFLSVSCLNALEAQGRVGDERVVATFLAEGGHRAVAGQETYFLAEGP